jgi:hypothetical protein
VSLFARLAFACAVATLVAPAGAAWADGPAPTKEELAAAKKAFEEGNALFKAGKLLEAIDKLKESYRLSRNAFLLYNIGHIYDQAGQGEMVLIYYRKFLEQGPPNAPMRDDVAKRVAAIEQEIAETRAAERQAAEPSPVDEPGSPAAAKPELRHEVVFTAPPGKPYDVVATLSAASDLEVSLLYRGSNDVKFTATPMSARDDVLVGRIPAGKMAGHSIQYYLEVRDPAGTLVTRSGKSTSPHLVTIEARARPHIYGEVLPDAGDAATPGTPAGEEDPLQAGFAALGVQTTADTDEASGSRALVIAKWVTTGSAAALLGGATASFLYARSQHDKLVADSRSCGTPPCQVFDAEFGQKVESLGKRYDMVYKVSLGVGLVTAGVAGYLWYRDLTRPARERPGHSPRWAVAPAIGPGLAGAAVAASF